MIKQANIRWLQVSDTRMEKSRESVTPAAVEMIWPVEALHENWMKHQRNKTNQKKKNLFLISSANIFPSKLPQTLNKVCAPDFLQV